MKILMVSQQVPHYTGGRYYAYQVACNLSLMGHEVTLLVDRGLEHFVNDYNWVDPKPRIVRGIIEGGVKRLVDRVGFQDLIIGVPIQGAHLAAGFARYYKCPMWMFIYDPPPLLAEMRKSEHVRETRIGYWSELRNTANSVDAVVITLGKYNVNPTRSWLGRTGRSAGSNHEVDWLHPAVNEHHVDYKDGDREQWATWISRIVPHKCFPHALDAIKPLNLHFNVVCSRAHASIVKGRGMVDRVTWLVNQPDSVKFAVLSRSMVLVHTATYEGFGMPLIEAMYCGVPVVCYDLPIYEEIVKDTDAIVFRVSDRSALSSAVGAAYTLALKGHLPRDTRYGMEKQRKRLKTLLERYI